jgi:glycosyltransferase involved in cell wall biosynthesis
MLFPGVWARLLSDLHGRYDVVIEEAIGGERAPFMARLLSGSPTVQFWFQDNRPLFAASYGRVGSAVGAGLQRSLLRMNRFGFALANSEATRTWLCTQGFARERTAVSYPRVARSSVPGVLLPFRDRRDRFVAIGNFRSTKRFEETIHVLVNIREKNPNAELVLIGREQDGGYLTELRKLVVRLRVESATVFRLGVSEEEKFALLSEAKALTIHSPVEGFGWTIPEAGLYGVPVVGNPGIPAEVLRDGINGVRVAFGDVAAYAREVGRLLSDQLFWETLSSGARRVAMEFVEGPVEKGVVDLLARVAHGPNSTAAAPGA